MYVILLFSLVCFISGTEIIAPKSSYVHSMKVQFNTDLNHLVVDRNTGMVYIGGQNRLYQLTSDLEIVATVQTGHCQNDSLECNMNKVLLIDYLSNCLITCGSNEGQCLTRNLKNISLPEQNVVSAIVSSSKNATVVAFIAPGPDARWNVMNVGATYDVNSRYHNEIPAVATRSLNDGRVFLFEAPGTRMFFNSKSYIVKYVYGFSSRIFSYFITIQSKSNSTQEYITKLVRICQSDKRYYSYTEIPMSCNKDGVEYNLVQAAYLSKPIGENIKSDENDDVLYAIFSKGINDISPSPSNNSALCVYALESIEIKFMQNIQTCFDGDGCTGLDFISPSKPCDRINQEIPKYFCGSYRNSPLGGEQPIVVEPMVTFEEQSKSMAVIQFKRNSLVLIGTADGGLKKFTILYETTAPNQSAEMKILENSSIEAMQFDLQQSSLYAMSKNEVVKVDLYDNCTVFSNCDECVGAKDLYCGWCPTKNSCSLEWDCLDKYGSSVSWKNYFWYQNGTLTQKICTSSAMTPNLTDFNFYPVITPYDSKTLIKFSTKNFISDFLPWYVKVRIAGIACSAHDIILHTVPLDCIVQANQIRQGKILIQQFGKAVISTKDIQFVDPTIVDFTPKYGPISGGTLITITGQYLNAGRKIYAFIGDLPCYIQTEEKDQVVCRTHQTNQPQPQSLKLRMTFDNVSREYEKELFQYGNDPRIISVAIANFTRKTPKCIPAGGLDIIVHGTNLKIVQTPTFYFVYHDSSSTKRFYGNCSALSDAVMKCFSPVISINSDNLNPDNPIKLDFGFIMDGVTSVQDLSSKGFAKFELFPNPTYDPFTEMVKYIENQQLTVTGKNLNFVCEVSDVRVFVGDHFCNITIFSRNLLQCQPPQLIGTNELFKVIVKVGYNLQFNIGVVSYDRPPNQFQYTIIIVAATLGLIIIMCIAVLSFRISYDRRLMRELKACGLQHFQEGDIDSINQNLPLGEQADLLPYDSKYEFPREQLKLGEILGSGAFGVVLKAIATKILPHEDESTVAVKMVKRNYDKEVMRALVMELKIMIHLGHQDNVVNLLGAVTKNIERRELMIIFEYCPFGNLKKYLETHRDYFIDQINRDTDEIDLTDQAQNTNSNHTNCESRLDPKPGPSTIYTKHSDVLHDEVTAAAWTTHISTDTSDLDRLISSNPMEFTDRSFSTIDLLKWALQIVHGMKHLESREVIHGDLAARNILLCDNNVVKICDFGLARSVYKTGIYLKKGEEALPLKWMALESIMYQNFTIQSDCWSFGIVLWELFSLGSEPYPNIQLNFVKELRKGVRNEKPDFSTQRIYELMRSCWRLYPETRPSFSDLEQKISDILSKASVN